jgi:hypothetical protein
MIGKIILYSFTGFVVFVNVVPRVIRYATGWEDTRSNEYERKKIQKWLQEDMKDKPVIPNSNGENYF